MAGSVDDTSDLMVFDEEHHYLSTACFHGKHNACRETCKFCTAECYCICHPEYGSSRQRKGAA